MVEPILITNRKIKSIDPVEWAPFRGFSLLFDHVLSEEPLYAALAQLSKLVDEHLRARGFCALPQSSYHVTLWDGFNEANAHLIHPSNEDWFHADSDAELLMPRPITFRVSQFFNFQNQALVADIEPMDDLSNQLFTDLLLRRKKLNEGYKQKYGFKPAGDVLFTHISLGYFANEHAAGDIDSYVRWMNEHLLPRIQKYTITFHSNSVYEYFAMGHFERRAKLV